MAQEAEEYRGEDEINKAKIEAKSGLENHCVTMRNRATEGQFKFKSETGDEEKTKKTARVTTDMQRAEGDEERR